MDTIYYRNSSLRPVVIKCLAEADKALRMHPWKETANYAQALHTVGQAIEGNCTPKSAETAFVALVQEQCVLLPRPDGKDLQAVDSFISEFRRVYSSR